MSAPRGQHPLYSYGPCTGTNWGRVARLVRDRFLAVAPRFTPTLSSLAPRIVHLGLKLNLEEMVKLGLDS